MAVSSSYTCSPKDAEANCIPLFILWGTSVNAMRCSVLKSRFMNVYAYSRACASCEYSAASCWQPCTSEHKRAEIDSVHKANVNADAHTRAHFRVLHEFRVSEVTTASRSSTRGHCMRDHTCARCTSHANTLTHHGHHAHHTTLETHVLVKEAHSCAWPRRRALQGNDPHRDNASPPRALVCGKRQ